MVKGDNSFVLLLCSLYRIASKHGISYGQ